MNELQKFGLALVAMPIGIYAFFEIGLLFLSLEQLTWIAGAIFVCMFFYIVVGFAQVLGMAFADQKKRMNKKH